MSAIYVDAKINNFVTRKLATMGENVSNEAREAGKTSGIYYEIINKTANRPLAGGND